ncbi:MAG: NADP-dependent succinic semialdehyde dehydrogenase [Microbacterium sp. SCN 70-18]|nr:MAG: NADP-dependent succinic semialdehyde dehydrogenase [Microbacterium sp. SCN 70-18]
MSDVITIDPATGAELGRYPGLDSAGIDRALDAAARAQAAWAEVPIAERAALLRGLGRLLRDEAEAHATLISREMGKPVTEALAEVRKCALTCDYYADHVEEFLADQPVQTEASASYVTYEPLGVVLAVMPWNFPYWQVIRFAAPTLAAGNGGLLKHASNVTGCALAIADVIRRAGFPDALFQTLVLTGHGQVDEIIADPRVAAVTLTGSEGAGASVAAAAGKALKKTVLELGGSDPFVVLGDADIEQVAPLAVRARFVNTGQSCLCAKRFPVEGAVIDEFEQRVSDLVAVLRVGDPLDPATQIGPLAKPSFVDDIDRQVSESVSMGARIIAGGYRIEGPGNYYAPTVLADVTPEMPVFREETFGPVMAIVRADDAAHAIRLADDTRYGLAASVWTADMERGLELGRGIHSGALFINAVVVSDPRLPFGGVKLSGYGRELSREGMLEFTNVRAVWAMRTIT